MTIATSREQYIVDVDGNKTAVILDIQQYEEILEDMHDLAIVADRRAEQPISLTEIKNRLNLNGTL